MAWDHFLQAAARITQLVRSRQSAEPAVGREVRALVSASSKGGEWRTKQAENAVSRSHLAWPLRHAAFSGNPGGDALAAYLRGRCGVRARRSVRVRSRTGRLRQSVLSSFHCLTFSSKGKLSPEPLRLTRPARADPKGSGHPFAAVASAAPTGTGARLPGCPSAVMYISPGPSQSYQVNFKITDVTAKMPREIHISLQC
jgi:hypothetical protein